MRRELTADPAGFALIARQAALAGPGGHGHKAGQAGEPGPRRLLLIVDQCEQLFTLCEEQDRHAFLTALYAAATAGHGNGQAPGAMVVLVICADFEARLAEYRRAEYPLIARTVQDRYLLTSMDEPELREAITQPAVAVGSRVEANLVDLLLSEMRTGLSAGNPAGAAIGEGALPLLSHALDQAWRARAGAELTLADYHRAGGLRGAIQASAQVAYERLSPAGSRSPGKSSSAWSPPAVTAWTPPAGFSAPT